MLQDSNRLVSCLQRCCKSQTVWFPVCNVVARPKPFGFLFAMMLQEPDYLVSRLQRCCRARTVWFLVCNVVARLKPFGFLFAELPRSPNHLVSHLRNSREAKTIWFLVCGTPARLFQYVFLFGRAIYCPIPFRALPAPTRAFRPHVGTDPVSVRIPPVRRTEFIYRNIFCGR